MFGVVCHSQPMRRRPGRREHRSDIGAVDICVGAVLDPVLDHLAAGLFHKTDLRGKYSLALRCRTRGNGFQFRYRLCRGCLV